MNGMMQTGWLSTMLSRARRPARRLMHDCRGVAATEFAMIVPIMLVLFFGVVEACSAIAIKRKVTLVARTLSDLTSQSLDSIKDADLQSFFAASAGILTPYSPTPMSATISEVFIDKNGVAKIQWSKSATVAMEDGSPKATLKASPHQAKDPAPVPQGLLIPNSWLIWSEVAYTYTPSVGYVFKTSLTLKDGTYTRPRQSPCVDYPPPAKAGNGCTPVS